MNNREQLRGLFLNTRKEHCSIHESGIMVFNILQAKSPNYRLDYLEIFETNRSIPLNYDFYIFNYHNSQMSWLDTSKVHELPGKKYTIVLEISPGNPFACVAEKDFDGYIVLDPTISVDNPKVFPFVRPLELENHVYEYKELEIPVIGSFGFPTPGKGFELLVDAVNKEFDRAVIKINAPSVNDGTYWHCYNYFKMDYTDYLERLCKSVAKPGIQIDFTREYLTKSDLINWCGANTLNCFMYNRFQTGLSATTDQAIVSARPLAISSNETFRHIHQYIVPYPYRSLKESIQYSSREVEQIKREWTNEAFQNTFIKMLKVTRAKVLNEKGETITLKHINKMTKPGISQQIIRKFKRTAKRVLKIRSSVSNSTSLPTNKFLLEIPEKKPLQENTILFVSHSSKKCGIHEFGWNLKEALKNSQVYHFCYTECRNAQELYSSVERTNPSLIVYNYYPLTMPWLTQKVKDDFSVPQIGYIHEFDQSNVKKKIEDGFFDFYICPDPSLELDGIDRCFATGRLLANYQNYANMPDTLTFGSFGFGFPEKGFERLVTLIQNEFDETIIRINMPFNDIVDTDGSNFALDTADRCRKLVHKPGIKLNITHDFLSKKQILDFLASNTMNIFLYDSKKTQGISSVLDYAISAQRPVAITPINMFRHVKPLFNEISIENNSLKSIINRGIAPLVPLLNDWSEPQMILTFEKMMDKVLRKEIKRSYWDYGKKMDLHQANAYYTS